MKLPNRIENLIIAIVVATLVSIGAYYIKIRPLEKDNRELKTMVMQLALVEKYRYEIKNEFDRMKAKEGQITLQIDNKMDASQARIDTLKTNSTLTDTPKKKGLLKRLFNK